MCPIVRKTMALGGSGSSGGTPDFIWVSLSWPSPAWVFARMPMMYSVEDFRLRRVKFV